jgi:YegS/Rv2252/BmrU family lipid kinase
MKNYFIINPNAGVGGAREELCEKINKVCKARGVDYEIYITKSVGDATDFVRSVCDDSSNLPARFFAAGGDGTLCEVVNGAIGFVGAEVGLIPIGTGNDFARNFSDKHLFLDIEAQLDGVATPIDVLKYNDSYSANMINIGFDCEVVKKKEKLQEKKYLPSKLAYIFGLVICLVKKPGLKATVYIDGEKLNDSDFLLSTFANGSFCGGGFHSNPRALLNDGKVDAIFVRNISRAKFLTLVSSYKKGTHIVPKNDKLLFTMKASSIRFEFPDIQSISVDGEIVDCSELTIKCVNEALSFVVPCGSASKNVNSERKTEEVSV